MVPNSCMGDFVKFIKLDENLFILKKTQCLCNFLYLHISTISCTHFYCLNIFGMLMMST